MNIIKDFDIIFLSESWTSESSEIELNQFTSYNFYRKFQHRNARRNSGGIVLYCRQELKQGITVVRNHLDTIIWIKLNKDFFKLERDIYLCGV